MSAEAFTWDQSLNSLFEFCKKGDLENVKHLHADMLQQQPADSEAWVRLKHDTIKIHPLRMAAHHGRFECVQYLLPFSLTSNIVLLAAKEAAGGGYWTIIDLLLPHLPSNTIGPLMDTCIVQRQWSCVRKLLPHLDLSDKEQVSNGWLPGASQGQQEDLVAVFYDCCDYDTSLKYGQNLYQNDQRIFSDEDLALMIRHHEAVQQRERLCEHILVDSEPVRKSKM